jgi:hypothetical protein
VILLPITLLALVALGIGASFGFAAGRAHERERRFDDGFATGLAAAESLSGPRVPHGPTGRLRLVASRRAPYDWAGDAS